MISVLLILWLSAFALTIGTALGKTPLWIAVLLITIAGLLAHLPIG